MSWVVGRELRKSSEAGLQRGESEGIGGVERFRRRWVLAAHAVWFGSGGDLGSSREEARESWQCLDEAHLLEIPVEFHLG